MLGRFTTFLKRPTSIHIGINALGNYINIAFTAVTALVVVRLMTPVEYGVLSVLLGIAYVLANVLDFGTTATIYSNLPELLEKKGDNLYNFVKTLFVYQSVFAGVTVLILSLTFGWLDQVFFKTGADFNTVLLLFVGIMFFIWQNFLTNMLLAGKKFLQVNVYINLSNALKLILLLVAAPFMKITPAVVIVIFSIIGSLAFFAPLILKKKSEVQKVLRSKIDRSQVKFGYTVTYFLSTQVYNLGLRMDLFMLSFFGLKNELGYYALAQKIILSIMTAIISITQVLSPLFSRAQTKSDVRHLIKPGLLYLSIPAALFVILLLTPQQVFTLFFTSRFADATGIAKSLAVPFILFTYSNFLLIFMLYTIKKAHNILISNVIYFLIMTVGCYYLIPKSGLYAPAQVITIALVSSSALLAFISFHEYKKLPA